MDSLKGKMLGVRPFKDLVRQAVKEAGYDIEGLARSLGFSKPEYLTLYLDGKALVTFPGVLTFAEKVDLDPLFAVRCWLRETFPMLLEFLDTQPAPALLTMNERRLINNLREVTEGSDAQVIVADGRDLLAVVMV